MKPKLSNKYSLCLNLYVPYESGMFTKYCLAHFTEKNYTQITFLPHITEQVIDEFLRDVERYLQDEQNI